MSKIPDHTKLRFVAKTIKGTTAKARWYGHGNVVKDLFVPKSIIKDFREGTGDVGGGEQRNVNEFYVPNWYAEKNKEQIEAIGTILK